MEYLEPRREYTKPHLIVDVHVCTYFLITARLKACHTEKICSFLGEVAWEVRDAHFFFVVVGGKR